MPANVHYKKCIHYFKHTRYCFRPLFIVVSVNNDHKGTVLLHYLQFDPSIPFSQSTAGYVSHPKLHDKMHVVCYVLDGNAVDVLNQIQIDQIAKISQLAKDRGRLCASFCTLSINIRGFIHLTLRLDLCSSFTFISFFSFVTVNKNVFHDYNPMSTGIPVMVLLTKIDLLCAHVRQDVTNVYRSIAVRDTVETLSRKTRIDTYHIVPVKSYESGGSLELPVDILALSALRKMLGCADDFLAEEMGRRGLIPGSVPDT